MTYRETLYDRLHHHAKRMHKGQRLRYGSPTPFMNAAVYYVPTLPGFLDALSDPIDFRFMYDEWECVAPPYENIWMEWEYADERLGVSIASVRDPGPDLRRVAKSLRFQDEYESFELDDIGWICELHLITETAGWVGGMTLALDTQGRVMVEQSDAISRGYSANLKERYPSGIRVEYERGGHMVSAVFHETVGGDFPPEFQESGDFKVGNDDFPKDKSLGYYAVILMLAPFHALALLGCKNVIEVDVAPPKKRQKRRAKHNRSPLPTYKILKVTSTKNQYLLDDDYVTMLRASKMPLHMVAGHFKSYDEKPLFGKITGRFWWPPHIRGNRGEGRVHKRYEVTT